MPCKRNLLVVQPPTPLTPHPSGVRRLHTGCCPKGSAADPVLTVTLALQAEPTRYLAADISDTTAPTSHPSGVRRLPTGCCTKGSAADPVLTVTLASKRSLLVV
ncbi:MAG: hypothetical protein LBK25_07640 [Treponema sp.]|nr:hypothetical protein [Treponema sp.]